MARDMVDSINRHMEAKEATQEAAPDGNPLNRQLQPGVGEALAGTKPQ